MKHVLAALCLSLPMALACAGESSVVRVYDGRVVEGPFVPPEAYAAYLKGVLAEEAGDLRSALAAYEQAVREDDEDPEPFTRIADVRCRLDATDKAADDALARALKIDKTYAPARATQARCAGLRGRIPEGIANLEQIATEDRSSVSVEALFVRLAAQRAGSSADPRARERAISLTLASGEHPAAWDALIAWGRGKSDDELLARGFEGLGRVATLRIAEVERGALELLGVGQAALARRVAASVADAPPTHGVHGVRDATVARLAVDEALLAGDAARAERRATRGHVPLSEVAARALLLERPELAARIASSVASADPTAGCALMVLAVLSARDGKPPSISMPASKDPPADRPAAACVLAFAERLAVASDTASAGAWVARVGPLPMAPHDPVTGPLAVELAARGVIRETALPLELRLELAARRREAPPPVDPAALDPRKHSPVAANLARDGRGEYLGSLQPVTSVLDEKHTLLWHTLVDPAGAPARTLLARMSGAAERDPIIGYSLARAALASAPILPPPAWAPIVRAVAASPAHPLLLAVAVEMAKRGGHAEDVPPARARLMAVARTPAERALAGE